MYKIWCTEQIKPFFIATALYFTARLFRLLLQTNCVWKRNKYLLISVIHSVCHVPFTISIFFIRWLTCLRVRTAPGGVSLFYCSITCVKDFAVFRVERRGKSLEENVRHRIWKSERIFVASASRRDECHLTGGTGFIHFWTYSPSSPTVHYRLQLVGLY